MGSDDKNRKPGFRGQPPLRALALPAHQQVTARFPPMNPVIPTLFRSRRTSPGDGRDLAVLIAAFTLLRFLLAACVPLLPQEAYYWTWSRYPDWSYFDHPPLASYSIALTTAVFGQTVFGIKSAAVLWALGWNLLWAHLITDMFGDRKLAFWSLLALNLTMAYEAYGFGPTPDGPLLFFWIATICSIWRLNVTGKAYWWYLAGACMGLSWLGKYAGVLLAPVVVLYLLTTPGLRHWFKKPQPYLAFLLAIAIFSPVLLWNYQHDWASLAFQGSNRVNDMGGLKPRFFALLLLTQFLILTPYVFVLSVSALFREVRKWLAHQLQDGERLLLLSALVPLVLFTAVSFRTNAKINWLLPAWWSLIILATRHLLGHEHASRKLVRGLLSSAVVLLIGIVVTTAPNLPVPGDLNSWSGWPEAAARIDRLETSIRAEGKKTFVFSPNHKISSLLWFHNAGQQRTYAQDIFAKKALQYDYFPRGDSLQGATGLLVVSDQSQSKLDLEEIRPFFDSVERVDSIETAAMGRKTRHIEIYRCTNYRSRPSIAR